MLTPCALILGKRATGGRVICGRLAGFVEIDGLLAKIVILSQPLGDVGRVEGLWPEALGINFSADEGLNHVAGVLLLRVDEIALGRGQTEF
jgi:hypothetical protein